MKKLLRIIVVIAALTSCEKEKIVPAAELPNEITEYVSKHFPANTIIQSTEDKDGFTKTYDVLLDGNISLEFNRKKEIIDIESLSELPNSVIPTKIKSYVETNYPNNVIIGWGLDDKNQEVELDNGVGLEFNMNGDFLRIDA